MAPEAKIAQVTSDNQNFDGRLKRKGDEPNGQKGDKCPKDCLMSPYLRPSMLQKVDVWMRIAQSWLSKMWFLLERGAHFCKNTKNCKLRQHFCEKMCVWPSKADSKRHQPSKSYEIASVINHVILQDGSVCKSNTFGRRFFKIRMGDWSGKAAKKSLRTINAKKMAQRVLIWSLQCSKSGFLKADCSKSVFKNVFPAWAGSIFL